jgi:DNA-binding response OmpR family regulator
VTGARPVILLVDDDQSTLDTYARALGLEGFETVKATSAEAALRTLGSPTPDAIIVDLHLPMADGLDFVRTMRARTRHARTPIALVTGDYTLSDALVGELEHLGVSVRYKPLWVEDLITLADVLVADRPSSRLVPSND